MSKTQSFYQSILQNSTLVVKVSGKICDNQQSIENVIRDIKELLSTISKLKLTPFTLTVCAGKSMTISACASSFKWTKIWNVYFQNENRK